MKQTAEESDDDDEDDDESIETQPPAAVVSVKKGDDSFAPRSVMTPVATRPTQYDRLEISQEHVHVWNPNTVQFQYWNDEDKRVLVVLIRLSSGVKPAFVDVRVGSDGEEIIITEKWDPMMLDAEAYYHKFPRGDNMSPREFNSRMNFMMEQVRTMKMDAKDRDIVGEYHIKTPFKVAPDDKKVSFTKLKSGAIIAHIDIAEKKKDLPKPGDFLVLYDSDSEDDDIYTPVKLGKRDNDDGEGKLAPNRSNRKHKPNPKYTDSEEE